MSDASRIVLITGAKGGLGNFVTRAFLEAGARVTGAARSIADRDFPHANFRAVSTDLSNGANAAALVDNLVRREGRIDGLVHLIGAFAGGAPVADTPEATFDQMLDLNLRSAFLMLRAALPHMREQSAGRIVAIGSVAALEPSPLAGAYAASKAALVSLVRTAARENRDKGIAANVVLPGTMDTPANRAAMPAADRSKWVDPQQVARLLVHLVIGEASQVTGAVIPVVGAEV
jgi:NAD(P)-dependent dehydrogenase (short-subunit alcohol dehydrogenase family)